MACSDAAPVISYEQPLNERVRTFLRLEFLFKRAHHQLRHPGLWSHRGAVESLIEIAALASRADIKKDLVKELERQATTLERLSRDPRVDRSVLASVLQQLQRLLAELRSSESALGQHLRDHELLSAVRQRSTITAGTCDFDLPAFHFWLRSPVESRARDLARWMAGFETLRDAVVLSLQLIRDSAVGSSEVASGGFFQRSLDPGMPCHMLRVSLPQDAPWYPEISAGRHRFTIRFMYAPAPETRAVQTDQDVEFTLSCCVI